MYPVNLPLPLSVIAWVNVIQQRSSNVNEVIRAVINFFTKRFHAHTHTHTQKHKNAHKRTQIKRAVFYALKTSKWEKVLFAYFRFVLFVLCSFESVFLLGSVFVLVCVKFFRKKEFKTALIT